MKTCFPVKKTKDQNLWCTQHDIFWGHGSGTPADEAGERSDLIVEVVRVCQGVRPHQVKWKRIASFGVRVGHSPMWFRREVLAVRRRERCESTEEAIGVAIDKRRADRPEFLAVG